ncbi:thioredoxin family protein [[Muricauda] lutisoli]|uniref:Thioredoxin family protein n=1 Tax=[Muricauda] lutisoli TaxID=2816035 RepID=A0ABS3EY94_9FLAO|nr:thioredoxin family protein [[Muricauda] lutisoli]MBO0331237.1 thioredoxin family protein [[Muricauda] lutisoli]
MDNKKWFALLVIGCILFCQNLMAQDWQIDFDEAQDLAQKNNKNIVLVFQGSDWCAPCIKLDREIWSSSEFQDLAKDRFVMLKADFPRRKKNQLPEAQEARNKSLAAKYNPNGYFPYVVVLNSSGKVLGQTGYEKTSPKAYFNKLNSF